MEMSERIPKHLRFTLAQRIVTHSLDIIELIMEAIYTKDRLLMLKEINMRLEILRILMRLCHRKKHLSDAQYRFISEQLDITGRMVGGWMKT